MALTVAALSLLGLVSSMVAFGGWPDSFLGSSLPEEATVGDAPVDLGAMRTQRVVVGSRSRSARRRERRAAARTVTARGRTADARTISGRSRPGRATGLAAPEPTVPPVPAPVQEAAGDLATQVGDILLDVRDALP